MKSDIKNRRIELRLNDDDKTKIEDRAKELGLSMSNYILKSCLGKDILPINQVALFNELRLLSNEVNSVGRNLNQYIKLLNMLNKVDGVDMNALVKVEEVLNEYLLKQDEILKQVQKLKSFYL